MSFLERLLETPEGKERLKRWCYVGLGVVLIAEIVLPLIFHGEHHFGFESFPAFGAIYGFISCALIIVVSKFIGKVWLMRPEDHYDD